MTYFSGWDGKLSPAKLEALLDSLIAAGVRYQLGAKANPLSAEAGSFSHIDCSGLVRWMLFHALGQPDDFDFPDGSVNQHGWCLENVPCKPSTFEDAKNQDDVLRIAFLSPDSSVGRHVMLVLNNATMESHGRTQGPSRREWGSASWMKESSVFVVAMP